MQDTRAKGHAGRSQERLALHDWSCRPRERTGRDEQANHWYCWSLMGMSLPVAWWAKRCTVGQPDAQSVRATGRDATDLVEAGADAIANLLGRAGIHLVAGAAGKGVDALVESVLEAASMGGQRTCAPVHRAALRQGETADAHRCQRRRWCQLCRSYRSCRGRRRRAWIRCS
jgi:hypothetical protein